MQTEKTRFHSLSTLDFFFYLLKTSKPSLDLPASEHILWEQLQAESPALN